MTNRSVSVYIAVSVDGFIAKPDGDIDWLHNPDYTLEGEDMGYHAFIDSIDALVMGRNSYEKVRSFDIDWPYTKPVIVLTSRPIEIPPELADGVIAMHGKPEAVLTQTTALGYHHLYLDGGVTIQQFLAANLVDRLVLTTIPILLGDGLPLFGRFGRELSLTLTDSKLYPNGFVQSTYQIKQSN